MVKSKTDWDFSIQIEFSFSKNKYKCYKLIIYKCKRFCHVIPNWEQLFCILIMRRGWCPFLSIWINRGSLRLTHLVPRRCLTDCIYSFIQTDQYQNKQLIFDGKSFWPEWEKKRFLRITSKKSSSVSFVITLTDSDCWSDLQFYSLQLLSFQKNTASGLLKLSQSTF